MGIYFKLTIRMLYKQKGRVLTIFACIFLSSLLLNGFCLLGYGLWIQLHGNYIKEQAFDSTEKILLFLALLLCALIIVCGWTLLHNLFSLTYAKRSYSLKRLWELGAPYSRLILMLVLDTCIIYAAAFPAGLFTALLIGRLISDFDAPFGLFAINLTALLIVSVLYSLKPAWHIIFKKSKIFPSKRRRKVKPFKNHKKLNFAYFMVKKYRKTHFLQCQSITISIVLAMILYIPASFLINTNISMNQAELTARYGIQYSSNPQSIDELRQSLKVCESLSKANEGSSMTYVSADAWAQINMRSLSKPFINVLKDAGWKDTEQWTGQAALIFLEDSHYKAYRNACLKNNPLDESQIGPAIMINKIINRANYTREADNIYPETPLYNPDISSANSGTTILYGASDSSPELLKRLYPDILTEKIPEDFEFSGNITLVLPLSMIETYCNTMNSQWPVYVSAGYEDRTPDAYDKLLSRLENKKLPGQLIHSRANIQHWYSSMTEIHHIMAAICAILLMIALVNIFSTIFFQYIERRHSLAILWSVGQTKNGLLKILVKEALVSFIHAFFIGILLSIFLCYDIYKIYKNVWRIHFILPYKQIGIIVTFGLITSAFALFAELIQMNHQDFLQDIRRIE